MRLIAMGSKEKAQGQTTDHSGFFLSSRGLSDYFQ
jgi:hypothetical protein